MRTHVIFYRSAFVIGHASPVYVSSHDFSSYWAELSLYVLFLLRSTAYLFPSASPQSVKYFPVTLSLKNMLIYHFTVHLKDLSMFSNSPLKLVGWYRISIPNYILKRSAR